jgi:hypothetical protein
MRFHTAINELNTPVCASNHLLLTALLSEVPFFRPKWESSNTQRSRALLTQPFAVPVDIVLTKPLSDVDCHLCNSHRFNSLCGLVVRVPGYRSRGPGSIPRTTRFSEK